MENSSKALLIAISVLVVIILISIGVKVFNSASNLSNDLRPVDSNYSNTYWEKNYSH